MVTSEQLDEWIAIPVDELAFRAGMPLQIVDSPQDVHRVFADDLWEEIRSARDEGREISMVCALGPTGQYPILAERVNQAQMPLDHVTFFGMDEWLDWQCRAFGFEHPYSLEGRFHRLFLDLLESRCVRGPRT